MGARLFCFKEIEEPDSFRFSRLSEPSFEMNQHLRIGFGGGAEGLNRLEAMDECAQLLQA